MTKNIKETGFRMNYEQILNFMFESLPMYQRQGKAAYKANLNNSLDFDKHLGFPHNAFQSIHIAGTNGKGSVSHMLASIFQAAGYKTGLYTSPHLVDYRERIKINGEMISKNFVCNFINDNFNFISKLKPSFFEMSVALAFEYFKSEKIDIAIIETGMGGRLDSTNIINPVLSVITNIGLDHTEFLGNTIPEIATEKAGIIKYETPVIIGEKTALSTPVFIELANKKNAEIVFAESETDFHLNDNGEITIKTSNNNYLFKPDLKGDYQFKNFATAIIAAEKSASVFKNVSASSIVSGLEKTLITTGLRGRWEKISDLPLTICDTAHNPEGLQYVIKQINKQNFRKLHCILGFVNDKDVLKSLQMFPNNAQYYFTKADIPRAMSPTELLEIASELGLKGYCYDSVEEAFTYANKTAAKEDMIFVGGSTFVTGDLIKLLENSSNSEQSAQ